MTWTKLGDEFGDEAAPLSDAAFRTHVEALMWSNRRLLDLVIPKDKLRKFAETDDPSAAVDELVERGWWQDVGDAWFVGCYFPEWQRDRVQVVHRREQEAIRQRRKRRHDLDDHELCLVSSRCRSASESPSRRDNAGDSRRDPGRDGTGQDGSGREVLGDPENERQSASPLDSLPSPRQDRLLSESEWWADQWDREDTVSSDN